MLQQSLCGQRGMSAAFVHVAMSCQSAVPATREGSSMLSMVHVAEQRRPPPEVRRYARHAGSLNSVASCIPPLLTAKPSGNPPARQTPRHDGRDLTPMQPHHADDGYALILSIIIDHDHSLVPCKQAKFSNRSGTTFSAFDGDTSNERHDRHRAGKHCQCIQWGQCCAKRVQALSDSIPGARG